jgi:hypothetical protein
MCTPHVTFEYYEQLVSKSSQRRSLRVVPRPLHRSLASLVSRTISSVTLSGGSGPWAPFDAQWCAFKSGGNASSRPITPPGTGPRGELGPQLTAFFRRATILASSTAVNSFSAKATGHRAPWSSFAVSLKPKVAYLDLNFWPLWKKQTTLPSMA